jgi:hypothetical protein
VPTRFRRTLDNGQALSDCAPRNRKLRSASPTAATAQARLRRSPIPLMVEASRLAMCSHHGLVANDSASVSGPQVKVLVSHVRAIT